MKPSTPLLASIIAICAAATLVSAQTKPDQQKTIDEAWAAVENFYEAFNKEDNDAMQEFMTFPHMFLSRNGSVSVQEQRWEMNFDRMKQREDWVKSTLDAHEVTMVYPDKVHFKITFSRHNKKGEKYSSLQGIYIVTKKDGKWGLQVRSY